jgi:uncharacterized protein
VSATPTDVATAEGVRVQAPPRVEAEMPIRERPTRRHSPAKALLLGALRTYQALRSGHPSPCRFYPTCSAYAVEAVSEHGAWRGAWLAVRRVARCRPFGGHGIDLVPPVRPRRGVRR